MFQLTYTTPSEIKGAIRLTDPFKQLRLGTITDAEGKRWDIRGYGSNAEGWWAWAVPLGQLHQYYSDTSGMGFGLVHQTWHPYKVETI